MNQMTSRPQPKRSRLEGLIRDVVHNAMHEAPNTPASNHAHSSVGSDDSFPSAISSQSSNAKSTLPSSDPPPPPRNLDRTLKSVNALRRAKYGLPEGATHENVARAHLASILRERRTLNAADPAHRIRMHAQMSALVSKLKPCYVNKKMTARTFGGRVHYDGIIHYTPQGRRPDRLYMGSAIQDSPALTDANYGGGTAQLVSFSRLLGRGTYGSVWAVNVVQGQPKWGLLAAKKAHDRESVDDLRNERDILDALSQLVLHNQFPNLPLYYGYAECPRQSTAVLFAELASDSLMGLIRGMAASGAAEQERLAVTCSCLLQAVLALLKMRDRGYVHDDAHAGNFLVHKVKSGGAWRYDLEGKTYLVPNAGHLVVLWDFGMTGGIKWGLAAGRVNLADLWRLLGSLEWLVNEGVVDALTARLVQGMRAYLARPASQALGPYWEHYMHAFLTAETGFARLVPTLDATDFFDWLYKQCVPTSVPPTVLNRLPYAIALPERKGPVVTDYPYLMTYPKALKLHAHLLSIKDHSMFVMPRAPASP